MRGHRFGLPFAIVVTVVAAGAATVCLRPRSGLVTPVAVDPKAYFSAAEIERARDFRRPQRALGLANLALSAGLLGLLALRPPAPVERGLSRAARRPLLGGAAAGAGLVVAVAVVTLPIDAVAHRRAVDAGLATQGYGDWLADVGRSTAVGAVIGGVGAAAMLGLARRFPRRWWAPASALVVAFSAAYLALAPVVLDPLFNRFTPLPPGRLRTDVLALARRAGVDVGQVFRVDASRRTTGANAYVAGLGRTKRVVLYDTLLERTPPDQVRAVVAHELGHVAQRDLWRGLAWIAIVAPAGTFLIQAMTERLARGPARGRAGPQLLPALALAFAVVSFALALAGNVLSRRVEARADAFALGLTRDPSAQVELERRLVRQNLGEPEPPAVLHLLFGTHPTAVERIGIALAWARER